MTIQIPPELFAEWLAEGRAQYEQPGLIAGFVADKTTEWAADQQLIRVIDWLRANGPYEGVRNELSIVRLDALATELWKAMRPKPPSLKERALQALIHLENGALHSMDTIEPANCIRRALESIPDADS
jgi:hypothetical protein